MKLWAAEVCAQEDLAADGQGDEGVLSVSEHPAPGTVVRVEKDGFYVQTGDGELKVTKLQIPGKKKMDAGAFLRGYPIRVGENLKKV